MDRISSLPDTLLHEIVSFLPSEDAIKTSFLSKRWSTVCSSLANFNFDQRAFIRNSRCRRNFSDFVNKTLALQNGLDISKFTLSMDQLDLSPFDPNPWLSFAVDHNVIEISLSTLYVEVKDLPSSFFTCNTLTVLTLHDIYLESPRAFALPKLKVLKLSSVCFVDKKLTNQLFSGCPLLEELIVSDCHLHCFNILNISAPNLKSLELLELDRVPQIEIAAGKLRKLRCVNKLPNISFETLLSLFEVEFIESPFAQGDKYQRASDLILGLQNVYKMTLQGLFLEFLNRDLPTIYNRLEQLQLYVFPNRKQVQVLISLLRSCPNLKDLCIYFQAQSASEIKSIFEEHQQLQEMSNDGVLKNLKAVNIELYIGGGNELNLVRFLLENAGTLEKMNIIYPHLKMAGGLRVLSINERIGSFKRASRKVVVVYIENTYGTLN